MLRNVWFVEPDQRNNEAQSFKWRIYREIYNIHATTKIVKKTEKRNKHHKHVILLLYSKKKEKKP